MSDYSLLRELYETELKLRNRNFAHGHSFEEWVQNRNAIVHCHNEEADPSVAKIRVAIFNLPIAHLEACNELADWIRRQVKNAGEPVGPLAVALVAAEMEVK